MRCETRRCVVTASGAAINSQSQSQSLEVRTAIGDKEKGAQNAMKWKLLEQQLMPRLMAYVGSQGQNVQFGHLKLVNCTI